MDDIAQRVESFPKRDPAAPFEHRQCRRLLNIAGTEARQHRGEIDFLLMPSGPAPRLLQLCDQLENWQVSRMESHAQWKTYEPRGTVRLQV
jgi:hypothetical protein